MTAFARRIFGSKDKGANSRQRYALGYRGKADSGVAMEPLMRNLFLALFMCIFLLVMMVDHTLATALGEFGQTRQHVSVILASKLQNNLLNMDGHI